MPYFIPTDEYVIPADKRVIISKRCETVTQAINKEFWDGSADLSHSFYVGSYGRHTAISTSDIDILIKLPQDEYNHYDELKGNGQSRLLQVVKNAVLSSYPKSNIHADGQVVDIEFSNGIKFELLPAFEKTDWLGNGLEEYTYPDTNMGGNWKSTNPKAEIEAMKNKNIESNGLFYDSCKHLRYIRDQYFSSSHLAGIVIDTFIYHAIGTWRHTRLGEKGQPSGTYENVLLSYYNAHASRFWTLIAPGSNDIVKAGDDAETLGKVLHKIVD